MRAKGDRSGIEDRGTRLSRRSSESLSDVFIVFLLEGETRAPPLCLLLESSFGKTSLGANSAFKVVSHDSHLTLV